MGGSPCGAAAAAAAALTARRVAQEVPESERAFAGEVHYAVL